MQTVRYFTPELYARYNSTDATIADAANKEWETATLHYKRYLSNYDPFLPRGTDKLRKLCFHDGLVSRQQLGYGKDETQEILVVTKPSVTYVLVYDVRAVTERALATNADSPVFASTTRTWLYDELEVQSGWVRHSILLSTGEIWVVSYTGLEVVEVPT
jgi:hypothetical protein